MYPSSTAVRIAATTSASLLLGEDFSPKALHQSLHIIKKEPSEGSRIKGLHARHQLFGEKLETQRSPKSPAPVRFMENGQTRNPKGIPTRALLESYRD